MYELLPFCLVVWASSNKVVSHVEKFPALAVVQVMRGWLEACGVSVCESVGGYQGNISSPEKLRHKCEARPCVKGIFAYLVGS